MISRHRDLRTGCSIWQDGPWPHVPYIGLDHDLKVDVAIVGGGISGAMMAESLTGHNLDVAVFDRRPPLCGSTAASTALLQYELDMPLIKLSRRIGAKKAGEAWRRSKLGLESLAVKIRSLDIDCGYERRNSLYLAGNMLSPAQLGQENKARNALGLYGEYVERKFLYEQYGIRANAGLMSWDNIVCNPVRLAAGFLNAAIKRGCALYSPVEIMDVESYTRHFLLKTAQGPRIRTRYVIFSTGYEIPSIVPQKGHAIHSTWALSTKPVKGLPDRFPLVWEAGDPYFYARTTSDRNMIFGGEDEPFSDSEHRDALIPRKQKALERKMRGVFPDLDFETEHVWTGSFGASSTSLPSIGRIPRKKNMYAVMAYGGNGITFSRIAAEMIAARILGYKDPEEALFSFKAR